MLAQLITSANVAGYLERCALHRHRKTNDCRSVHFRGHLETSEIEGVQAHSPEVCRLLQYLCSRGGLQISLFRNSSTQRVILRWILITTIFYESKAFEKSKYTTSTDSTWSVMNVINYSATVMLVRHERLGMNPC